MIEATYISKSEQRELMALLSHESPSNEREEWESEESTYEARKGYEEAVAFRRDPEAFALGGPLYGLHPNHARQIASMAPKQPIGWRF